MVSFAGSCPDQLGSGGENPNWRDLPQEQH